MNYEVKRFKDAGVLPRTNSEGQYGIDMFVWTGVVGNSYDMLIADATFCPLDEADGKPVVESKMSAYAVTFSAVKYPNT